MDMPSLATARPAVRRAAVAAIAIVVATVAVAAGFAVRGMDITSFVVAGELSVEASDTTLTVNEGAGYDGQYFYRLAVAPFDTADRVEGVRLDLPGVRAQRIVYPLIAGTLAGFDPGRVPWTLVLTNILALGALAVGGAARARQLGRTEWAGLAVAAVPGFLVTLFFNLSEIVAAAFLVWAMVAIARDAWVPAAGLLTVAALTRETTLILSVAGVVCWVWFRIRREAPAAPLAVFAVPLLVGVVWQGVVWSVWGQLPLTGGATLNLGLPLSGLLENVFEMVSEPTGQRIASVATAVGLGVFVLMVTRSLTRTVAAAHERVGFVMAAGLMTLLTAFMYSGPQHFLRAYTEVVLLGIVILIGDHGVQWRGPDHVDAT